MKEGGWYRHAEELVSKGYWVIDIPRGGKRPARLGWTKLRVSSREVEDINRQAYDPGVGILTGVLAHESEWSVVAIDIDITEAPAVERIVGFCREHIGPAPARLGNPPKTLLVYKYKGVRKKSMSATSAVGRIEYLGTGQQFVAHHIHPKTNEPYQWDQELPEVEDLEEITEEHIQALNGFFRGLYPDSAESFNNEDPPDPRRTSNLHSNSELLRALLEGDVLHDTLLNLSYQLVKDGMPVAQVTQHMKGLMEASKARTIRPDEWLSRYTDLPRIVSGAVERIKMESQVAIPRLEEEVYYREQIPWPPGLMGRLTEDAYEMAMYKYREVALVSSLALVAGVAGRAFNVSNTGLNVYLTLVMGTGMGKESITEFIVGSLMRLADMNTNTASFIGSARFTGPRSLLTELKGARCQVSVLTEAGLLLKSQAGDQAGLSRVMLALYSKSGCNAYSGRESFSKAEESLPMLKAPCLSLVHEATPETLLEAFKDQGSLEKGEIPRQSIFRISGDKPYPDFNRRPEVSQECLDKLSYLVKRCAPIQAMDDFKCHNMIPADEWVKNDMTQFAHYCVDMENKFRVSNRLKQIMHSRAYLKALKFAALASVFNHREAMIYREEWEWAKSLVVYEMSGIDHFFAGGGFTYALDDFARGAGYNTIVKMLHGKVDPGPVSSAERKQGIFSGRVFKRLLANNSELNKLSDHPQLKSKPLNGATKLLDYMVENGFIEPVPDRLGNYFRITEDFNGLRVIEEESLDMGVKGKK